MKITDYSAVFYIEKNTQLKLIENFYYIIQSINVPLIGSYIDFEKRLEESIIENDIKTSELLENLKLEYKTLSFQITDVEKLNDFEDFQSNGISYFNFLKVNIKPILMTSRFV